MFIYFRYLRNYVFIIKRSFATYQHWLKMQKLIIICKIVIVCLCGRIIENCMLINRITSKENVCKMFYVFRRKKSIWKKKLIFCSFLQAIVSLFFFHFQSFVNRSLAIRIRFCFYTNNNNNQFVTLIYLQKNARNATKETKRDVFFWDPSQRKYFYNLFIMKIHKDRYFNLWK